MGKEREICQSCPWYESIFEEGETRMVCVSPVCFRAGDREGGKDAG